MAQYPIYYVAGMNANFYSLCDAMIAGAEEAIRTGEQQDIIIDNEYQSYTYCKIIKGNQA